MSDRPLENEAEVVLDISRLISRILHHTPTGVDRVEMAYARGLKARLGERLRFAAVHPIGRYGRIPTSAAGLFLDRLEAAWDGRSGQPRRGPRRWWSILRTLWMVRPRRIEAGRARTIVQSTPHHLDDERLVRTILRRERARLVCLLHDLIPIEYPEYARPGGSATHVRRVETVARRADAIIANSAATRRSFLPYLRAAGRDTPVVVAHLGIHDRAHTGVVVPREAYFVCLGTIEPRKNHLLLLNIWRELARSGKPPRLVIVGRRGWENEQVIDMLERCPAIHDSVEEHGNLPDDELWHLLAGARALLMPSFAEGYGMPVTEALAAGVPVICSDLASLREAGGEVPDYVDALDGIAWKDSIADYATPGSVLRQTQMDRLANWRPPSWEAHIDTVLKAIGELDR